MADKVATFTDQNWEQEVLRSPQPVLVDFWAEWCIPCRTLTPLIESVAREYDGKLKVGKFNVEDGKTPNHYNVTTLPTLLLLKGGQVADQRVGLLTRDALQKLLAPHLG